MTRFGMFLFMTILGLYLGIEKFKKEKNGFNPFRKYTKKELKMFQKANKLEGEYYDGTN